MPSDVSHRFIISTNVHQQDSRQRELQISNIRSHARHVSYLKWRNGPAADWRARTQYQQKHITSYVTQNQTSHSRETSQPVLQGRVPGESSDSVESRVQIDEEDILNEAEAEIFLKDVWMPNPAPTWSKGDPFECIPGSNELSARIGLDFCELDCCKVDQAIVADRG